MELRRKYERSVAIGLEDLQAELQHALAEELGSAHDRVGIRAEETADGLGAVTTLIVLWVIDRVTGKTVDLALDALWDRVLDRLRARNGSHVLKPAESTTTAASEASH